MVSLFYTSWLGRKNLNIFVRRATKFHCYSSNHLISENQRLKQKQMRKGSSPPGNWCGYKLNFMSNGLVGFGR